jgi:PAS domain S-box-containing protein
MVGQNVTIIVPPPWKEQHDHYLQKYLRTGIKKIVGKTRVVEGLHKNGTVFPMRLSVAAVVEPGQ